jgi:hypothetical protein
MCEKGAGKAKRMRVTFLFGLLVNMASSTLRKRPGDDGVLVRVV